MGHPGTLPTINRKAVQHVLLVGRALGGTLATYSEFDRKNYFYPDIPKGYQISQYAYPLVSGGMLADVAITRVHLEEDTARSSHDQTSGSLIDFNRAGVPLMELVTEPVMHDAQTAGHFARELQLLLRALGVSDANMERGEMRVEVNISISTTDALGTKVEVKNINSFHSVESAIAYEIERQMTLIESGKEVAQETRGWDEVREATVSQRKKESSDDYRYFPEPDLPKLSIPLNHEFTESRLDEIMPEIPSKKRLRLSNLGVPSALVEVLISDIESSFFFDITVAELESLKKTLTIKDIQKVANYVTSDLVGYISAHEDVSFQSASPSLFARLLHMLLSGEITSRVTKDLLPEVVFRGIDPETVVHERGLLQKDSANDLVAVIDTIIKEHALVVKEYSLGKKSALQFLIGQCMKVTKGAADPLVIEQVLISEISSIY